MDARELTALCRDLLRIDTSNPGATEERAAAYVLDTLARAGVAAEVVEAAPGRCSVVSCQPGAERELPALLVHGHLDVVPPQDAGWTHDPFGGVEADGCLWGRGALDMKGFVATMLAVQLELARSGARPRRDLVFAYFADEETGGPLGSAWLVAHRPDLFVGVAEAIGEVGGFAVHANGRRLYPVQTAEKGALWARIEVRGRGGHAAYPAPANPLTALGELVGRIARLETDDPPPEASTLLRERLASELGADVELERLGSFGATAAYAERTTFAPTIAAAGAKTNIVPDRAELVVDCRPVPGGYERALAALRGALDGTATLEVLMSSDGLVSPARGPLVEACARAVAAHDPDGVVVPFVMPGGTDAQRLAPLGIAGYGFTPLTLPPDFEYFPLFHAPDERVPVAALAGGWHMLRTLVTTY